MTFHCSSLVKFCDDNHEGKSEYVSIVDREQILKFVSEVLCKVGGRVLAHRGTKISQAIWY